MLVSNGNASFLYRAEVAKKAGLYDAELNGAEDMDMWLRMTQITRTIHVESILYYYMMHTDSMTHQVPEKIRNATTRMIDKFLAPSGGNIDVDRIFPAIAKSGDPPFARWQARIWLATRFANTPFMPVGAVVNMLITALTEKYDPALVANIVHLLAHKGMWDQAENIVNNCAKQVPSEYLQKLSDIIARRDMETLKKIPFAGIPDSELSFDRKSQLSRAQMSGAA